MLWHEGIMNGIHRGACLLLLASIVWGSAASAKPTDTSDSADDRFAAELITAANIRALDQTGTNAAGGIGDWHLTNGVLCAIVSSVEHGTVLGATGGSLVDLSYCDRGGDQWIAFKELLNGSRRQVCGAEEIVPQQQGTSASLVVRGRYDGVHCETRYAFDDRADDRLRVTTSVERRAEGERVFSVAASFATAQSFTSFVGSANLLQPDRGFVLREYSSHGIREISKAASPADLVVNVGRAEGDAEIAYGRRIVSATLENEKGEGREVPVFLLVDQGASVALAMVRPFWLGSGSSFGLLQLLQTRWMDLRVGHRVVIEQEVLVGDRADVASITDRLVPDAPLLTGSVDDASAVIHIETEDGAPITATRPEASGDFSARVPAGRIRLRVRTAPGREVIVPVEVGSDGALVPRIAVGTPARVTLPAIGPARLVFIGEGDTPDPDFDEDLTDLRYVHGRSSRGVFPPVRDVSLGGVAGDPAAVRLAPGTYRVLATRGPEYSVTQSRVEVKAEEEVRLAIDAPALEVPTKGWIAADFHVHSGFSMDNPFPLPDRLAAFAGQGGEVLVATEHENAVDLAPAARALGYAARLALVTGVEVTDEAPTPENPNTIGHANIFPYPPDPTRYMNGAPLHGGLRWRDVIAETQARHPASIWQLNHAQHVTLEGKQVQHPQAFLSHMGAAGHGFDPSLPLTDEWNRSLIEPDPHSGVRDIDFDAIELLNGKQHPSYEALRETWFSMLRQGERLVGTANSDSHHFAQLVAVPRNYVRQDADDPRALDERSFVEAIRQGHVYGTTGPILDVRLGDAHIGDQFAGDRGTLVVSVRAAHWVPVSELRVFVNGERVYSESSANGREHRVTLDFSGDSFVTVEVAGEGSELFAALLPGHSSFAFTNPIFVDADANGAWEAPGPGQ